MMKPKEAEPLDDRTLSGLLALLAHDLRNPLAALQSNVGFLGPHLPDRGEARDALSDAIVSCEGLLHVIDNIELFSQAVAGGGPRATVIVSLGSVVAEAVAAHRALAASHGTTLEIAPQLAEARIDVVVHRELFRRAFANLLRNGIQHSSGRPVVIFGDATATEGHLMVADRGPNLSDELRDQVFTAPGQLVAKTVPGGRYGRGLGLYCAAFAADASGARVEVATPPAGFSCAFALIAPLA